MKQKLLLCIATVLLLLFSNTSFSQVPNSTLNLGILESFEAYTADGGVTNSGGTVTGDVGTNSGIISGFPSPPNIGNSYTADASTNQARYDLLRLYIHLNSKAVNFPNAFSPFQPAHAPVFTGTLTPGVYAIGAAGSISGALTLDGGGDPDAVFVIKINGALTVTAASTASLVNGAKSSNVFWLVNGAISVGAGAQVIGTLFSKAGAVGLGAGVILEGRMLTLGGALTMGVGSSATIPPLPCTIPIFCESGCAPALAVDVLGVLSNFVLFAKAGAIGNTGLSGINGIIAANTGSIAGYASGVHIGSEEVANALTVQAAVDLDAAYNSLMAMIPTVTTHAASFLNETVTSGIYHIGSAGDLGGVVILDGANDPNAIFVFRFAGAFNIAASSKIILANGARRCNVFWIGGASDGGGALNIGASSEVQGTFLAHGGACNSGAGVFMSGRQLSTLGAVNTNNPVIYGSPECVTSVTLKTTAVTDSPSVASGANTPSVIANDISKGVQAVIGTAAGQVTLSFTNSGPLTMNPDGTITVAANASAGTYPITYTICEVSNPTICSTVTSNVTVTVSAPAIVAVADTPSVLPGTNTPSVILNDTLNGVQVVIGTAPGNVTLTFTNSGPLTMNTDGTIAVAANTPAGTYTINYTICEVNNPGNCSAPTTVTVTVTAPAIVAVADTPSVLAGTNTPSVLLNDTVNGVQAVIGTAPGQVTLTFTNSGPLTMNPDGTITVAANTPAGTYTISYTICEVNNPTNCNTVQSTITVTNPASVGGTSNGNQIICKDSTPNDITITGNTGNVVKWQKSIDLLFTSPTDILSTSTTLSGVLIGNISETTYFRAVVQDGSSPVQYSPVVTVTIPSTTWDGSSWSNGAPIVTTTAFITGNYSVTANILACTLTVSNGAIVAIPSGSNVTLNGKLTVAAGSSFTLNSNSNLIQQTAAVNSGDITVKRMSTPLYRLDYTLWSSPVSGSQTLLNFSPLTSNISPSNIRFYSYNTASNQYNSVDPATTVFEGAKSYLIRSPNNWISYNADLSPAPQKFSGSFIGVPRNGTITYTMANTGNGFNAIGNPFPSVISLDDFINDNNTAIEGTLWFWRKFNEDNNLTSYTACTTVGCTTNNNATYIDSDFISVGQGFIVKAKSGQTNLNFTSTMRSSGNVDQFFRTTATTMDRFWLKMTNAANKSTGQNLIAYTPTATNDYDSGLDGLYLNESSVAFYSKAAANDVVINARPSFEVNDVIPMHFKSNVADTYTFTLNQKEGIFDGTQAVFLRDNYNNIVRNLTLGNYTFSTPAGTFTDRFDIIYQNLLINTNPTLNAKQIIIYNNNQTTFISSGAIAMESIKIFDIQGRLLFSKSGINDTKTSVNLNFKNQVLLFHITSQDGDKIIKKVIN